jgi:ELWxxDGT repeat protein
MDNFINVNGTLLFGAQDTNDFGLWRSDGTVAGTVEIKPGLYLTRQAVVLNGILYFFGRGPEGKGLWRSDGSESGTSFLKSVDFGDRGYFTCLISANGVLWFTTQPGELWKSDGSVAGTIKVADGFRFPRTDGEYAQLSELGGTVFFAADDGVHGAELWKFGDRDSDGDGLPDWWEQRFFGGLDARPEDDPDGDGMTNWQESRAGTDPNKIDSVLKIANVIPTGEGKIRLEWPSVIDHSYALLRSSQLSSRPEDYTIVARGIWATPPTNNYVDTTATGQGPYFYRLRLE